MRENLDVEPVEPSAPKVSAEKLKKDGLIKKALKRY